MAHETRRGFRGGAADAALDLTSSKFNPREFILAKLKDRTGGQLLDELRTQGARQAACEQDTRNMVAQHLNTFVACKDTVEALHASDKSLFTSSTLKNVLTDFNTLQTACNSLFQPLLERERELAEVKQAEHVFHKVEFLFAIPETIKKNIASREYASVVFDYRRAKAFEASMKAKEIPSADLFDGVFDEVNEAVSALQRDMRAQMQRNVEAVGAVSSAATRQAVAAPPASPTPKAHGAFTESSGIVDTSSPGTLPTAKIISLLRSLDTPDVDTAYIDTVRATITNQLHTLGQVLLLAIEADLAANGDAVAAAAGDAGRRSSVPIPTQDSAPPLLTTQPPRHALHKSSQFKSLRQAVGSSWRRYADVSGSAADGAVEATAAPQLDEMLTHITEACALTDALEYVNACGTLLKAHLTHFLQTFQREWWSGDDVGENSGAVQQLFTDAAAAFDDAVWPVVCQLQPCATSGVSLQRWRSALFGAATPAAALAEASAFGAVAFQPLCDKCHVEFHKQTSGKLTAEIASWGEEEAMAWDTKLQVSKALPTTALPLKFETAVVSQLEFLASGEGRLKSHEHEANAVRAMVRRAHEDFVDLLHYLAFDFEASDDALAFGGLKGKDFTSPLAHYLGAGGGAGDVPTREERLLVVWSDCKALQDVILENTYGALRAHLEASANALPIGDRAVSAGDQSPSNVNPTPNVRDGSGDVMTCSHASLASSMTMGSPPGGALLSARFHQSMQLITPFDMNAPSGGDWLSTSQARMSALPRQSVSHSEADEDLNAIKGYIRELRLRIVREVVGLRMGLISEIVCVEGFLKTDINWAFCPEPRGLRNYCHTLLLNFVELHEATVRLTGGQATREVMTTVFNQTMGVMLHAVRQLDFYNCSDLASLNATLQVEVEVAFLAGCMGGFKHAAWQGFYTQITDHLMQFYVNSNEEATRRKRIRNRKEIFDEQQRLKALVEALKVDPAVGS